MGSPDDIPQLTEKIPLPSSLVSSSKKAHTSMDVDKCEDTCQLRSSKESQCYVKSNNDDNTKPVIMDSNKQIQKDCIGELHGVSCSKLSLILNQQKTIGSNNFNNNNNHYQYQQLFQWS